MNDQNTNYGEEYMNFINILWKIVTIAGIILFFVGIGLINQSGYASRSSAGSYLIVGSLFIPSSIVMMLSYLFAIPARAHAQMVIDTRIIKDKLSKIESNEYDDDDEF